MRQIGWDEVGDLISQAQTAYRFEQQPAYAVDFEAANIAAFLQGDPQPPTEVPEFVAWFRLVADRTAAGARIERVRVHQDPPTDYQRWVRWLGGWNVEAGEIIHYITPEKAAAAGLEVTGPDDWWLLDDARLIILQFDDQGVGTPHLVEDATAVADAKDWWILAKEASA